MHSIISRGDEGKQCVCTENHQELASTYQYVSLNKGKTFHSGTKISVNFTLGICTGVIWKNKQSQLIAEVLHIISVNF